jgi:hypothetical protein
MNNCIGTLEKKHCVQLDKLQDWNTKNLIGFRVSLKSPVYFAFNHPLTRFKKFEKYQIGGDERSFCTELGWVPAYMLNLDRFTVLRLWGTIARQIFSPDSSPFLDEDYVFWRLNATEGTYPEVSSLNFVLKQSGNYTEAKATLCKKEMQKYFTFLFWSFESEGFSENTILIGGKDFIHTVIRASKSLYIPGHICSKRINLGRERDVEVSVLPLDELGKDEKGYFLQESKNVILATGIADSLENEQRSGSILINGVISDFLRRSSEYRLLTAVQLYEVSNWELFMSLIGIICRDRFYEGNSFGFICSLPELKSQTYKLLNLLLKYSCLDKTMGDSLDLFSTALSSLKPFVILNDQEVYFLHPSVFIALMENSMDNILQKQEDLALVLRFLDRMGKGNASVLLSSEEAILLKKKGYFIERILSALKPTLEQIELSRTIKKRQLPSFDKISPLNTEKTVQTTSPKRQSAGIESMSNEQSLLLKELEWEERVLRRIEGDSQ